VPEVLDQLRDVVAHGIGQPRPVESIQRRARPPRRRRGVVSIVLVAATLLVVLGVVVAHDNGRSSAPATAHSAAAEIDQFAVDVSVTFGVESPASVTWVASTEGAATSALMSTNGGTSDVAVYAIEVNSGNQSFSYPGYSHPQGVTEPHWKHLTLIVDQATFATSNLDVSAGVNPMTSLGVPETDSLVGIKPMSKDQFRSKFHLPASTSS
jgi:hypothetical protein